jgi:hypothetical protein
MALPTLHARYSLPNMAGRFLISFGFASICCYVSQLPGINSIGFLLLGAPFVGMGLEAETSANLRTDCLEVDWSEVLRIAGAYTLIRTHDWSQDFR